MSRFRPLLTTVLLIVLIVRGPAFVLAQNATPTAAPSPPEQPAQPPSGPGGAQVNFDGIRAQHVGPPPDGTGDPTGYWIFEPIGPHPGIAAGPLPLVLFLHGFDVSDPEIYHAWIDHLVRRGAIVVFPDYQTANLPFPSALAATDPSAPKFIQTAVRAALAELAGGAHVRPDVTRMAVIGHSLGTLLAAAYAAGAAAQGLPVPAALLLAMPGCAPGCDLAPVAAIPATTRVVVLVGNQDTLAGEGTAKQIWAQMGQVPSDHKTYARLIGDDHGQPPLVADHFVAMTTLTYFGASVGALNAFDYYGMWKWFDALMSCSFANQNCQYALGNTPAQRFMGTWSDGVPVAEPQVTDNPAIPATPAA